MMMTGLRFAGERAFDDVLITGTVLDRHGQRMSKMKGNGVDPMDVFEKYGVDATRITLASSGAGTDIRWRDEAVESYRNFANKIWNAARFALMNSEGGGTGGGFERLDELPLHDRWIWSRLNRASGDVRAALDRYAFHEAVYTLYHFFWDDFCDWYIELAKADVTSEEAMPERDLARSRLLTVLEQALRLLHPFMPYITEDLWRRLPGTTGARGSDLLHPAYRSMEPTVMLAAFPQAAAEAIDERAEEEQNLVIEFVTRVRSIRSELNIKPGERIAVRVGAGAALGRVLSENEAQIKRLARLSHVTVAETLDAPRASARGVVAGGVELAVPLEGLIDFERERQRLTREIEKLAKELERGEGQLSNTGFIERAPAEKIEELRARVSDARERTKAMRTMLDALAA
jgi:valyl-tRNA synthetase